MVGDQLCGRCDCLHDRAVHLALYRGANWQQCIMMTVDWKVAELQQCKQFHFM